MRGQEVRDALDDDSRLAGAGPGDDHHRSVAVLHDGALLRRQRQPLNGAAWCLRDGDG